MQESTPNSFSDLYQIDSLNELFDFKHYTDSVSLESPGQAMSEKQNTTSVDSSANPIFDTYNKSYTLYSSSQKSNESIELLQIRDQLAKIRKQSMAKIIKPTSHEYHITKKTAKKSKKLIQNQQNSAAAKNITQCPAQNMKNRTAFILLNDLITGDAFDV